MFGVCLGAGRARRHPARCSGTAVCLLGAAPRSPTRSTCRAAVGRRRTASARAAPRGDRGPRRGQGPRCTRRGPRVLRAAARSSSKRAAAKSMLPIARRWRLSRSLPVRKSGDRAAADELHASACRARRRRAAPRRGASDEKKIAFLLVFGGMVGVAVALSAIIPGRRRGRRERRRPEEAVHARASATPSRPTSRSATRRASRSRWATSARTAVHPGAGLLALPEPVHLVSTTW